MTKCLPRIRRQLKNDNRGASLVTVVVIAALVLIMVTVLLSMVILNYYMKNQNIKSQKNFYDAESAMEEIRLGLTKEVSQASGTAYAYVLSNYSDLTEQEKTETFEKEFFQQMQSQIKKDNNKALYNCQLLASFLKGEGAAFETPDDNVTNALDDKTLEAGKRCLVLRNVKVSYTDAEDNYSEIQTDIDINYPDIDFSNASSRNNILCYSLIAGEDADADSVIVKNVRANVSGNVYLGTGQIQIFNQSNVTFVKSGNSRNYAIGGDVVLNQGKVQFDGLEVWTKNIFVSKGSSFSAAGADTYLQNDLVLSGNGTEATLENGFYAYGNPEAIKSSESYKDNLTRDNGDNLQKALASNEADFSSSIILDGGKTSKLDMSQVSNLMIAGTSYINTNKSKHSLVEGIKNNSIETGQSVMTTSDQRAYLIPGDVIGKGYENGGANPMTAQMYQKLKQEIMEAKGYTQESQIQSEDLVDFTTGGSQLGSSLQSLGVNGYDVSAIQVSGVGSMYYFFMKFDTQANRNAFVKKYYSQRNHYNQLQENLGDYAGAGVKLPENSGNPLSFYLQGNALVTEGSSLLVSDTLEAENEASLKQREAELSDSYMGLLAKLEQNYDSLTTAEKRRALFDNLIDGDSIVGADKYFVSANGVGTVVTGNDIKVSTAADKVKKSNVKDAGGNSHFDATINLIISKGNVVVDDDFEGLIICKGSITLKKNNLQIKADANKASQAFFNSDTPEKKSPADYLKDETGRYMIGGMKETENTDKLAKAVRLLDSVTYSNWEKH